MASTAVVDVGVAVGGVGVFVGTAVGGVGVKLALKAPGKAVGIHSSACDEGAEDGEDGVVGSGKAVGSHAVVGAPVGSGAGVMAGTAVGVSIGGVGAPVGPAAIGAVGAGGWALSQATDAMASATAMMASAGFRADSDDRRTQLSACSKAVKIFVPLSHGEGYSYSREIVNRV